MHSAMVFSRSPTFLSQKGVPTNWWYMVAIFMPASKQARSLSLHLNLESARVSLSPGILSVTAMVTMFKKRMYYATATCNP